MALERGYKAWAERMALSLRGELGVEPEAPVSPHSLAAHLGIELLTPAQLPGLSQDVLTQLLVNDPSGWSAVSFEIDGVPTVIYNGQNSKGRQSSDILHEFAHVIRAHEPSQLILSDSTAFAMRSYDSKQEDEANWLGWAILLPRVALERCLELGLSNSEIAQKYVVSETLVEFRRRMTGIDRQNQWRTGRRSSVRRKP
jgi:Zn-dependent peptidase ImmA (M78 family)